jgi:hydroxymethylbilane synthase
MAGAHFRLGTRGSALALAQAKTVADALGGAELVAITTSGDRGDGLRTRSGGGRGMLGDKSRFVREIERALLDGEVDLAVHSAKDLPGELPDGLEIAGVPEREDPRDAFVGTAGSLAEVPEGARIGTSSLRRRAQLLALRPDLEIAELRGNVDTRLAKLDSEQLDGLVLAAAGLNRLGRASEVAFAFDPAELTPAPGQSAGRDPSRKVRTSNCRSRCVGCDRSRSRAAGPPTPGRVVPVARCGAGSYRCRGWSRQDRRRASRVHCHSGPRAMRR